MGRGGVWHGMVPKNAKIGSEVDFSDLVKKCPIGQGAQNPPKNLHWVVLGPKLDKFVKNCPWMEIFFLSGMEI